MLQISHLAVCILTALKVVCLSLGGGLFVNRGRGRGRVGRGTGCTVWEGPGRVSGAAGGVAIAEVSAEFELVPSPREWEGPAE